MDENNMENQNVDETVEEVIETKAEPLETKEESIEAPEETTEAPVETTEDTVASPSYLTQPDKKKNNKIVAIIIAVVAVIAIVGGIFAYNTYKKAQEEKYRKEQQALLETEMSKLTLLNITSGSVDMTIKTEGDYAKVEKTIKEYFQELLTTEQHISSLQSDERFTILNEGDSEEFWSDQPEFAKTTEAIATLKTEMGTDIDTITALLDEKAIEGRIDSKIGKEYKKMYNELMLSDSAKAEYLTIQTTIDTSKTQLFNLLDKRQAMIDLLKSNQGQWKVEGTQLYFYSEDLMNQYNAMVEELNNM